MRIILTLTLTVGLLLSPLFAATTGKIAGIITDEQTGEPLSGVNVVIEGTTMGAATDLEGRFVILNIPPGTYTLRISMIGYANYILSGVRVEIDLTTNVDVRLKREVLKGEAVEVVAERKVIRKDVAGSQQSITSDEIAALPVSSVQGALALRAGITSNLEIRGASASEALVLVDGIVLRDQRNNAPMTSLPLSAMQEISVQTGGFNAEYSNVRSGVVNVVTKEGSSKYYGGTITLRYSPPAQKHFGMSAFDPNSYWLRPYLDDAVCWTGTDNGAWDTYTARQYPSFEGWNTIAQQTLEDNNPNNDLTPQAAQRLFKWQYRKKGYIQKPDYNLDFGFGGPFPGLVKFGNTRFYLSHRNVMDRYLIQEATDGKHDQNTMLKVTTDLTPSMKLSLIGMYGELHATTESRVGSTDIMEPVWDIAGNMNQAGFTVPWRIYTNIYWCPTTQYYSVLSARLIKIIDPGTFWEAQFKRTYKKYHTVPSALRDTTKNYEIFPGYYVDEAPEGFWPYTMYSIDGGLAFGGAVSTSRDSSRFTSYTARFDYTSQINFRNQIKTGIEFNLDMYDMSFGLYNAFLPEGNTHTKFQRNPIRIVGYLQDKLEYEGFITTVGVIGELIHSNGKWYDVTPYQKDFFSQSFDPAKEDEYKTKVVKPQFYLSPRVNVSHPITVNSKLYFNYNHNLQTPTAETLYRIQRSPINQLNYIGDPSIPLSRTISYELGYDHALYKNYLFHLAAYYRDIDNVTDWTRYINIDGKVNYYKLTTNSYSDIRGIEVELSKLYGRWWSGNINYEYRVTTSGYFGIREYYENPAEQREYLRDNPYQTKPRPIPRIKGNLDLHTPADFGPQLFGQRVLGGWHLTLLGYWREGYYMTWNPNGVRGVIYNLQWKNYNNFDLKVSKVFDFDRLHVKVFADVSNLFNFKYFSNSSFVDVHDYNYYMYSLHLPKEQYKKLGYNGIPGNDQPGEFRKAGVKYQPMEYTADINTQKPTTGVIYWDAKTEKYYEHDGTTWQQVAKQRIDKILENKAYIDMPNQTFLTFLDPRDIFFGMTISFDFNK